MEDQITIGMFDRSDLILFGVIHIWWMESSHVLKMAMLKWKDQYWHVGTLTWWRLKAMAFGLKEINSSGSNSIFIWSWVNRYVVLLRGMHHVDRWLFISAQANACEVWVKERHTSSTGSATTTFSVLSSLVCRKFWQESGVPRVESPSKHREFRQLA